MPFIGARHFGGFFLHPELHLAKPNLGTPDQLRVFSVFRPAPLRHQKASGRISVNIVNKISYLL